MIESYRMGCSGRLRIKAANAAGMFCVAVGTTLEEKHLSGAQIVVRELNELHRLWKI